MQDFPVFEIKLKSKTKTKTHPMKKSCFGLGSGGRRMGYNPHSPLYSLVLPLATVGKVH